MTSTMRATTSLCVRSTRATPTSPDPCCSRANASLMTSDGGVSISTRSQASENRPSMDDILAEPRRVVESEAGRELRIAHVRVDRDDPLAGTGEGDREVGDHRGLALPL